MTIRAPSPPRLVLALLLGFMSACSTGGPTPAPRPDGAGVSNAATAVRAERALAATTVVGTVGVPPFAASGTDSTLTPLAYAVAELVANDLGQSGRVRIVERSRLADIMREMDLVRGGKVDSASAPRLGRFARAERLVLGSLAPVGNTRTLLVGARISEVESSRLTKAVDAQAPLAEILAAEKALVFRLFEALGVVLTPAERATIEAEPTKNIAALLAYGRGLERFYMGDYRGASSELQRARLLDPGFRQAGTLDREVRSYWAMGTSSPIAIPGVRPLDGAIAGTIDRLNRPLDLVTNVSRTPGTAADPSFTGTQATVIITIIRP